MLRDSHHLDDLAGANLNRSKAGYSSGGDELSMPCVGAPRPLDEVYDYIMNDLADEFVSSASMEVMVFMIHVRRELDDLQSVFDSFGEDTNPKNKRD